MGDPESGSRLPTEVSGMRTSGHGTTEAGREKYQRTDQERVKRREELLMKFIKRSFMLMTMLIFLIVMSLQVQASECEHVWGEWEYGDEPTCTEEGTVTRWCENCFEEQTKSVPALGHKWSKWQNDYEPTCTEEGSMTRWCENCFEEQTKSVPALGEHKWGKWKYDGEYDKPTCTEKGIMIRECQRKECDEFQTKSVPALGHEWDVWKYVNEYDKPTCTEKGTMIRGCQRKGCDEDQTKSVPALGEHKWGKWKYDDEYDKPTCTEKGTITRECQRKGCGEEQTQNTPALGHKWDKWYYDSEDKPTCTKKGIMIRECQREGCYEEQRKSASALGHKWGKWHVDVEPTVLKAGKKSRICVRCKKGETNVINKLKGVYGKSSTINTYPEKKLNVSNIGLKGKKKYTSSNKKVATVNSRGIIQTKKAGKCKITVKSGKQSYKINLVVNKPVLDFESFIKDYDTRNNVFYVVITNNGTNNLKITSGIKVEEVDYKSFDRKISTKAVTIKPRSKKTIKFKVKGGITWYDYEDFTLYYKIKYGGKTYTVGTNAGNSWLCKK